MCSPQDDKHKSGSLAKREAKGLSILHFIVSVRFDRSFKTLAKDKVTGSHTVPLPSLRSLVSLSANLNCFVLAVGKTQKRASVAVFAALCERGRLRHVAFPYPSQRPRGGRRGQDRAHPGQKRGAFAQTPRGGGGQEVG